MTVACCGVQGAQFLTAHPEEVGSSEADGAEVQANSEWLALAAEADILVSSP